MATDFTSKDQVVKVENTNTSSTNRNYASAIAEKYVEERKQKAGKQGAKFSQADWDDMKSYKYTIF